MLHQRLRRLSGQDWLLTTFSGDYVATAQLKIVIAVNRPLWSFTCDSTRKQDGIIAFNVKRSIRMTDDDSDSHGVL